MDNTVMQIRISKKLKKQSMVVAENLGFTASTLIKLFLAHVVQTRKIPFEIQEIPNAKFIKEMKQAERDYKAGKYYSFDDMDDAINFLKKGIKSKGYGNQAKLKLQKKTKNTTSQHPRKSVSKLATV